MANITCWFAAACPPSVHPGNWIIARTAKAWGATPETLPVVRYIDDSSGQQIERCGTLDFIDSQQPEENAMVAIGAYSNCPACNSS